MLFIAQPIGPLANDPLVNPEPLNTFICKYIKNVSFDIFEKSSNWQGTLVAVSPCHRGL